MIILSSKGDVINYVFDIQHNNLWLKLVIKFYVRIRKYSFDLLGLQSYSSIGEKKSPWNPIETEGSKYFLLSKL